MRVFWMGISRMRRYAGFSVIFGLLVVSGFWFALFGGCSRAPRRPNVLLIILDTTRADAIGAYGSSTAKTPHIDALAARGLLFKKMVTQNPYTLGSITTILTSLPPDLHGIRDNSNFKLAGEAETLAESFKAGGFATAAFVSAYPIRAETGIHQGFDLYDDDFSMGFPVFEIQFEPMKATRQGAERRGGETVSRAIEWLEPKRRGGNPFFLLVHLFDPHQPYDPPPPFQAEFRGNPYGGEVAYCDSLIGSLLGRLEQQDLLNSTIVAVVSDHGEAFHEHEEVGHGFLLYETTMRVPWIMAGPQIPAASIEGTARLIDVAPTLMGACGLKIPAMFQGDNLMSELAVAAAGSTIRLSERPTYFETYYPRMTHHWSELLGWRDGPWKYIRGPRPELFNLERDPDEALDLYHQERAKAAELSAAMDDYLQRSSPYRLSPLAEAPDAETMEKLRSLGYLGGSTPERAIERPGWECGLPDPKDAIGAWNLRQEANAFLRIALVQFQAGQFEKALEWADRSLASDESRMDALMVRAKSLAALNRLDEAHDSFEKLLRHQPEDAAAWSGFGIVQDRLGRPARAEEAFVKSIELDSTLSDAHFNMGSLLIRQGRIREAVPYYEAVRRLQPEDASLRADLARLYMSLEKVQDMESVLEEGYATDPRHPGILLLLAQLRIHQGNLGEGRQLLERYLELYPERPDAPEVRTLLASLGDES